MVATAKINGHTTDGGDKVNTIYYDWFEIQVNTALSSFTNPDQFAVTNTDASAVYDVGWGDGSYDLDSSATGSASITHTYASGGVYNVRLIGDFNWRMYPYGAIDDDGRKVIDVMRFGALVPWTANEYFLAFAPVTTLSAPDIPVSGQIGGVGVFQGCETLVSGPENWTGIDRGASQNLIRCFQVCRQFNGDISGWVIPNLVGLQYTFNNANNFNRPLGSWDVTGVTSFQATFLSATQFNDGHTPGTSGGGVGLGIDTWNVTNSGTFNQMFQACVNFNTYIGSWRPGSNTGTQTFGLKNGFASCLVFNQDIGDWCDGGSRVTLLQNSFTDCHVFNNGGVGSGVGTGLDKWNTTGNTSLYGTFARAYAFNQYINSWDVGAVTEFNQCFLDAFAFNQDLSSWRPAQTASMFQMFEDATAFNNGGVGSGVGTGMDTWTTGTITSMGAMFKGATSFNQYIGSWDMTAVTSISNMFQGATSFTGGGVGNWTFSVLSTCAYFSRESAFNTSIDWDMRTVGDLADLFYSTPNFNGGLAAGVSGNNVLIQTPTGGTWSGGFLFGDCPSFNQDVSTQGVYWDMSLCNNFGSMFRTCTSFNQNIGNWNTGNVVFMANMFQASGGAFNQDISGWSIASLTNANSAFTNAAISRTNYDLMLDNTTGWASQATIQSAVTLGMGSTQFTLGGNAEAGHNYLTGTKGWNITDGGGV